MRIMIKEVGHAPRVEDIELDLAEMQDIVGGYIECLSITDRVDMWLNEEGKLIGLPLNMLISHKGELVDTIQGDVFFASHDGEGETVSLTEEDERVVLGLMKKTFICRDPFVEDSPHKLYPIMELGGDADD